MKKIKNQLKEWLEIMYGNEKRFINEVKSITVSAPKYVLHEVLFSSDWIAVVCRAEFECEIDSRIRSHITYDELEAWIASLTMIERYGIQTVLTKLNN
jgi:hypothetical protein